MKIKTSGFIEFNPNKCFQIKKFKTYFDKIISYCYFIDLVRYDLAIDIPFKRNTIKMIKSSKCVYEFKNIIIKDGIIINNSFTEYQGRRNKNKFTKLYDKTAESKLNYDLTRIEFTFDKKETEYKNLPKFLYVGENRQFNYKDNLLIDLLINCDNINYYLRKLNYKQRKRIEPYLKEHYITFDYVIFQKIREKALSFEKN